MAQVWVVKDNKSGILTGNQGPSFGDERIEVCWLNTLDLVPESLFGIEPRDPQVLISFLQGYTNQNIPELMQTPAFNWRIFLRDTLFADSNLKQKILIDIKSGYAEWLRGQHGGN